MKKNDWRNRLEHSINSALVQEYVTGMGLDFRFGKPISKNELEAFEATLTYPITQDLKHLWSEFNGVQTQDEYTHWDSWGSTLYFSTHDLIKNGLLTNYINEHREHMPPQEHLDKTVFFAQQNGLAMLYALCIEPFEHFKIGQVLSMSVEVEAFKFECDSLEIFVSTPLYCLR